MNILFVDDNWETCELFQLAFSLEGMTATTASNGLEAVEAVKANPYAFDALILDIEMPVMDGLEALKIIRLLPEGRHVPVVVFTGYSDPEYRTRALRYGANELLYKPLMPHELVSVVRDLVKARSNAESGSSALKHAI